MSANIISKVRDSSTEDSFLGSKGFAHQMVEEMEIAISAEMIISIRTMLYFRY
jgi:hypothetical protein